MLEEYQTLGELKEFAEAQHQTIVVQSKRIQHLEAEVEHLKSMLSSTVPIIAEPNKNNPVVPLSDEESISRMELSKLRGISSQRDLTMEEARKVEIYSKILNQGKDGKSKPILPGKNLTNDELLTVYESESKS